MRRRPASRLLVLDSADRVLLFHFVHRNGALAGISYWATPGGGLEAGETFESAACRELREETGLAIADPGPEVFRREAVFPLPDGEPVLADERFFVVRVDRLILSMAGWTGLEREVMAGHRWWSPEALRSTAEQVWPEGLLDILVEVGAWVAET